MRRHNLGSQTVTVGVEEEYWIVSQDTLSLSNSITTLLPLIPEDLSDKVKQEFLQCQIEVSTPICRDAHMVETELRKLRRSVSDLLSPRGLRIAASATHPFSHWRHQLVTPGERYKSFEKTLQETVRRLLTCGMHVHVGFTDMDSTLKFYNGIRKFLPFFLALSTNSPFYAGRKTGLMSYRSAIFRSLPRTGIPPYFLNYEEYVDAINVLVKAGEIDDPSSIWWDVRIHHKYKTVEIRICDVCTSVDDAAAIVALIHAMAYWIIETDVSVYQTVLERDLIEMNKWHALRYGVGSIFYDPECECSIKLSDLFSKLMSRISPHVSALDYQERMQRVEGILVHGNGADYQLREYEIEKNLKRVTQLIVEKTLD